MSERESWMKPIEEIWAIRRRLLAQFDNDLPRYVDHLKEWQEQYHAGLVRLPAHEKEAKGGRSAA
jgi:hypothetical protein